MHSRAPLIFAIVLLLLPVLYLGSYLALVVPQGQRIASPNASFSSRWEVVIYYRLGSEFISRIFWPLEQIDRRMRPVAWGPVNFDRSRILPKEREFVSP